MERRALCHNNIGCFILVLVCSCKPDHGVVALPSSDKGLHMRNGILYHHNKLFSGFVYELFPNKKDTSLTQVYSDGREDGEWRKFFSDGRLQEQRYFVSGIKIGTLRRWWSNGKKMLDYNFKNGEYEGTCREWNEDGALLKEMNYSEGYETGAQKMFYDNGKIRSNYVVIDGRRFGLLGTKNCINASDSIPLVW